MGTIVPFSASAALQSALDEALGRDWNPWEILAYARANSWDRRVETLVRERPAPADAPR